MPDLAPRISGLAASATFNENVVNATGQLLQPAVTLIDPDATPFNGGVLTIAGILAEDRVSLRNVGSGPGQLGFNSATGVVTWGGVTIGQASGGSGASFTVTFNSAATTAMVEAVIENLTYANDSDDPTASRALTLSLTDSASHYLSPTGMATYTNAGNLTGVSGQQFPSPALADMSGDGLLDIVLGDVSGQVRYFRNTGTATAPAFTLQGVLFSQPNGDAGAPTVGDIDGDGDLDILNGTFQIGNGTARYLNTSATSPAVGAPTILLSGQPNFEPFLVDIDADGDLDLYAGNRNGNGVAFYRNTGTASAAVFTAQASPFSSLPQTAYPSFADFDGDGDFDVLFGVYMGSTYYFRNSGTAQSPTFVADTAPLSLSVYLPSAAGDIDGDGDLDLIAGDPNGPLIFYRNNATPLTVQTLTITVNVTAQAENTVTFGGSAGPDTTYGAGGDDVLAGSDGKDTLSGLNGADALDGGADNDVLYGGGGADDLVGGAGNDWLQGDAGDDELIAGDGSDKLFGGQGADTLQGEAGLDRMDGGADDDILLGGDANDYLDGGAGADALTGGLGNDIFVVDAAGDTTLEDAAGGYDIVRSSVTWTLADNIEGLVLQAGAIDGTGNALANNLQGGSGANHLLGLAGVDTLNGNDGDDVITGGTGNDLLRGGTGADTFAVLLESLGNVVLETDVIYDFSTAEGDTLDFSAIDANGAADGEGAFQLATGGFTRQAGEMTLSFTGGQTLLRLDLNGDGRADYQLRINGDVTGDSAGWAL